MPKTFARPFEDCRRELAALRSTWPEGEIVIEPCRGEVRLAAEAALHKFKGLQPPLPREVEARARVTLGHLAHG